MKKTLLCLTLALCNLLSFAQHQNAESNQNAIWDISSNDNNVGYNASIFTKAEGDELFRCEFSNNERENGVFSTGRVSAEAEIIDGQYVSITDAHRQQGSYGTWAQINNTWTVSSLVNYYPSFLGRHRQIYRYASVQDFINDYMNPMYCSSDNGWMMMDIFEQQTIGGAAFNAYITFKQFNLQGAPVFDVEFYQWYMKFYDKCFVDYSLDNGESWTAVEINVTNIDCPINGTLKGKIRYTMPNRAAYQANESNDGKIRLRLRWYSNVPSFYAGYGYAWMIDDFRVIAGSENRITPKYDYYTEGFYQLMPKGMNLPLFWHSRIVNSGSKNQENIKAYIYNNKIGQDGELVSASNNGELSSGATKTTWIDSEGLYANDSIYGWYCMRASVQHAINGNTNHLKNDASGDYYVYARITANPTNGDPVDDMVTVQYDTLRYHVNNAGDYYENAYVWGHDDGIVVANSAYTYGLMTENDNSFITENSPNYNYDGYEVSVRYTLGENVPKDANGQPWVIRGVEYVPATSTELRNGTARILPTLKIDSCVPGEPNQVHIVNIETGAGIVDINSGDPDDENNPYHIFNANYLNNNALTRNQYEPIFVEFPEQPALEAYMSYRVGYKLIDNGNFAVAASAPHHTTHCDNPYDVRVYDHNTELSVWASQYYGYYPMIHLVVGPKVEREQYAIDISCGYGDMSSSLGTIRDARGNELCNTTDMVNRGSTISYSVIPDDSFITSIEIDGEIVWNYLTGANENALQRIGATIETEDEERWVNGDYEQITIAHITFNNVSESHTLYASFSDGTQPQSYTIATLCDHNGASTQLGVVMRDNGDMLCGTSFEQSEYRSTTIIAEAFEGNRVDSIAVNDQYAWSSRQGKNPELTNIHFNTQEDTLLTITLTNIQANHIIKVFFKEKSITPEQPEQIYHNVNINCHYDQTTLPNGKVFRFDGTDVCGSEDSVIEGISINYIAKSITNNHIDSISVDNQYVWSLNLGYNEMLDEAFNVTVNYDEGNDTAVGITIQNVYEDRQLDVFFKEDTNDEPQPLSIAYTDKNISVQLTPNPAKENVTLLVTGVLGQFSYTILDVSGRPLCEGILSNDDKTIINLSSFAKGTYFVRIIGDNCYKVDKLIVQ